jgi:hypothetical protein
VLGCAAANRVSGACASGLVVCGCAAAKKGIWSVCFQAAHTRGLARAAAAYASASSACPDADADDADVARKKSETPGSGAGGEILPLAQARENSV